MCPVTVQMLLKHVPYVLIGFDIVVCAIAIIAGGSSPARFFDEGQLIDQLNFLQLVAIGLLSAALCAARIRDASSPRAGAAFWLLAAAGGLYLAVDELLELHESGGRTFKLLRVAFGIQLPDYITVGDVRVMTPGDLLQLGYAIPVLALIWLHRREFGRDRRALAFFGVGAFFLAVSMLIDLTGFYDEKRLRFDLPGYVDELLWAIEESVKLIGFGAILVGTGLELTGTCAQRASDSG